MIYLQTSLGPHGNLKSSNCVVDRRFVLKVRLASPRLLSSAVSFHSASCTDTLGSLHCCCSSHSHSRLVAAAAAAADVRLISRISSDELEVRLHNSRCTCAKCLCLCLRVRSQIGDFGLRNLRVPDPSILPGSDKDMERMRLRSLVLVLVLSPAHVPVNLSEPNRHHISCTCTRTRTHVVQAVCGRRRSCCGRRSTRRTAP